MTLPQPENSAKRAKSLLVHCDCLLQEIDEFEAQVKLKRGLSRFRNGILASRKQLEQIVTAAELPPNAASIVTGSNLTFYQSVWDVAKQYRGVVALSASFNSAPDKIDIVAQHGHEWIKVFRHSERKIVFDFAKQGLAEDDLDEACEDVDDGSQLADIFKDMPIFKLADGFVRAAKSTVYSRETNRAAESLTFVDRYIYRPPKITFAFPNITTARTRQVDALLSCLQNVGINVMTDSSFSTPAPSLSEFIQKSRDDEFSHCSPTLNLETSILVTLVSDTVHKDMSQDPRFSGFCKRTKDRIANESHTKILRTVLFPLMVSRRLICTVGSANLMRLIVANQGTFEEKHRASLIMGEVTASNEEIINQLQDMSDYPVPKDLQFPVALVNEWNHSANQLPPMAAKIEELLVDPGKSSLLYGWKMGCTTVTSSQLLLHTFRDIFHKHAKSLEDFEGGPDIFVAPSGVRPFGEEFLKKEDKVILFPRSNIPMRD